MPRRKDGKIGNQGGALVLAPKFVTKWVEAYNKDFTQEWVARELNVSEIYVRSRAEYLRRKGVNLPKLVTNYRRMMPSVEDLNRIIEDSTSKEGE